MFLTRSESGRNGLVLFLCVRSSIVKIHEQAGYDHIVLFLYGIQYCTLRMLLLFEYHAFRVRTTDRGQDVMYCYYRYPY